MTNSLLENKHPDYTRTFAEVYLAELDYVKERRDKMDIPSDAVVKECDRVCDDLLEKKAPQEKLQKGTEPGEEPVKLSTNAGLVGLALSGGGIRSATFNLGLLQVLAKRKVLQYCDYLSTVSGGGYIGSCVSSLLAKTPEASSKPAEFPLRDQREGGEERQEVDYLRATKNYLGLSTSVFDLDNWHIIGLNLSAKLLLNTILLALVFLLTLFLFWGEERFYFELFDWWDISASGATWIIAAIAALIVVGIRWGQVWGLFGRGSYKSRQRLGLIIAYSTVIAVILGTVAFLFNFLYTQAWEAIAEKTDSFFNFYNIVIFLLVASIAVIMGGHLSLYKSSTRQKLFQVVLSIALITLLISLFAGLLAVLYKVEYEGQISHLADLACNELPPTGDRQDCVNSLKPTLGKLYIDADGYLREMLKTLQDPKDKFDFGTDLKDLYPDAEEYFREKIDFDSKAEESRRQMREKLQVPNATFDFDDVMRTLLIAVVIDAHNHNVVRQRIVRVMLIISVILLLIGLFTNINYNALHCFYRDRLSKTFLIRRSKEGEIKPNDPLLLTELHQHNNGPYHLVNTTLNVPSSTIRSLQKWGADFFTFSKLYCGAESTGYRSTVSYNKGQTTLATAMAISGAAASPEMGQGTNSFLAPMMTLLNYRLHQWLPHPKFNKRLAVWGPSYLFKELFRRGTENDKLLNLSDGGHHENLGVYSLLKRRCKLIIASDAGADPDFQMTDLAKLRRKACLLDGINIEIDTTDLRPDEKNRTKAYFVKGTIHYPGGEEGTLFYIKTTMIGSEPEQLQAYRRKHPTFPDETTADQFFNEEQFESYRKLGELVGEMICSKKAGKEVCDIQEEIEQIFGKAARSEDSHNG